MALNLANFAPKHKWLVCIDSDGCAIDSMEVKHRTAFGPAAAVEWEISGLSSDFLNRWNEINLYSGTRGINRFKGLSIITREYQLMGWQDIETWAGTSSVLSNDSLTDRKEDGLVKALSWSLAVNKIIEAMPLPKPFMGVEAALKNLQGQADIAIVSSANLQAIQAEWDAADLTRYVSSVTSQNDGSKSSIISCFLNKGYTRENVLVVGDAPGDMKAAEENGVAFYPIVPGDEVNSWQCFADSALREVMEGGLSNKYIDSFCRKLGIEQ